MLKEQCHVIKKGKDKGFPSNDIPHATLIPLATFSFALYMWCRHTGQKNGHTWSHNPHIKTLSNCMGWIGLSLNGLLIIWDDDLGFVRSQYIQNWSGTHFVVEKAGSNHKTGFNAFSSLHSNFKHFHWGFESFLLFDHVDIGYFAIIPICLCSNIKKCTKPHRNVFYAFSSSLMARVEQWNDVLQTVFKGACISVQKQGLQASLVM